MRRRLLILVSLTIAIVAAIGVWLHASILTHERDSGSLPFITLAELGRYDGSDPDLPIYLGLDGYVFDVTAGRSFYASSGPYHYLAGKDSTRSLRIMGAEIIKAKYPVIGRIAPDMR